MTKNESLINRVLHGDCLELANEIEPGSVDLILTDLPYGTIKGLELGNWSKDKTSWDIAIEPRKIFEIANRILRKNGKMVLFSQEPYTTKLINDANPNVPFNYRMIWEKDHFGNGLSAKKAPVSFYEDILIFSKTHETQNIHPLRGYAEKVHKFIGLEKGEIIKGLGMVKVNFLRYSDTQFALCPKSTYEKLIELYSIDKMAGFMDYDELSKVDRIYKSEYPSVFNLWEGKKHKSNIFKYKKDYDGFHPTQKPVLLLEDLIKTFSNEGDTIVDLTSGSCSTAVASINTSRNFICIEKEWDYCLIGNERIKEVKGEIAM